MASIGELLAMILQRRQPAVAPPPPAINEERPWETPMGPPPEAVAAPPAPAAEPYYIAPPDPFAEAQQLEARNQAVAQAAGPASPLLGLPSDVINYLASLAGAGPVAKVGPGRK